MSLGGVRGRIYDLIARHFVASVSPDCKFVTTKVNLKLSICMCGFVVTLPPPPPPRVCLHQVSIMIGEEGFSYSARTVTDPGFTALLKPYKEEEEGDDGAAIAAEVPEFNTVWHCFGGGREAQTVRELTRGVIGLV